VIRGVLALVLLVANTLILFVPLLAFALVKLLLPLHWVQARCSAVLMWIAETWAEIDKMIFACLTATQWDIRGMDQLQRSASYLVVSNHQSWVDIPALIQAFNRKIPYFKFFLKKELIWVPLLGFVWWVLDYPFMKRYSKEFLARHPHLKGKDLEITRRSCEKFKLIPVTVVNYLEGTRFAPAKHQYQQSPYRHLLKPKSGGMAFALNAMGEQFRSILDVTIVYPMDTAPSFWDLLSGKVERVVVDVRERSIKAWMLHGDYESDPVYRDHFQAWVTQIWQEKDALIDQLDCHASALDDYSLLE
jgi:1-acyl-sn-glycerol-3-phosphate acyltransferase